MTGTIRTAATAGKLPVCDIVIGGREVAARTDTYIESVDPTLGVPWYRIADASDADVDDAVRAARSASATWASMRTSERCRLLRRVAALVGELADELAWTETRDNGKLLRDARTQIAGLVEVYDYFSGWPDKFGGTLAPTEDRLTLNYVRPEPVGVVAAIVPWNSPMNLATQVIAPALAAGNTIVLKPSEHASRSLLTFARSLGELLPVGVINVITGLGAHTGDALARHPGIDMISFTGGVHAGRAIAAAAASRPIKTVMELGGKSPTIVFADADLEKAAQGIAAGIFTANGQTCVATSRCLIEEAICEEVVSRVSDIASQLRLGNPLETETEMGPVAYEAHMRRVLAYITDAREKGAIVRAGGSRSTKPELADGYFVEPTVLDAVDDTMTVTSEEVFGPVLVAMPFRDENDAIRLANATPFGLNAVVWTRDASRAQRMAYALDSGMVLINTPRGRALYAPFGGFKDSGYGKVGGKEAVMEYIRLKNVYMTLD